MNRLRLLRRSPKVWLPTLIVGLALLVVALFGASLLRDMMRQQTTLYLGDGVFTTQLATTPDARTQGLSGTTSLVADQAMLFVFPRDERWGIWMKDMNYPIDVVWLDANKHVVYIVKNMSPDSYPTQYTPESAARYVVELPAGTVEAKAIGPNSIARFDPIAKEVQ